MLMGLATFCIGLLPTYASVGIWAGILLVLVRVVQGLAYGAEWGGAILMTYEHAPWRNKGKYTGIVQAGFPVGLCWPTASWSPSTSPAPGPGGCRSCCPSSWSSSA